LRSVIDPRLSGFYTALTWVASLSPVRATIMLTLVMQAGF
jgi:hypothetical protein